MKILILILIGFSALQAKSFDQELKAYLNTKLTSYERVEFTITKMPKNFKSIKINNERELKLIKNNAYVSVKIYDGRGNESLALITLKVKLFKKVLVANKKINANEILTPSMFKIKFEDVSQIDAGLVEEKDLELYKSRFIIKEGSILSLGMVEIIPAVNSGDKVVMHTGKNGVEVSLEALAKEDGLVGDIIRVQANNRVFKAKIIDKYNIMLVD